jgi:hypothetical protein
MIATHGEPTGVSSTASICPLHRYGGKPREAEDASTGGREIDHSTARIRAPISYGNDNTAPISAVGNSHPAAERQRLVRGGQCTIMQSATAGRLCAQFACGIERGNAAFGARRGIDDCERSRRNGKCLHITDSPLYYR